MSARLKVLLSNSRYATHTEFAKFLMVGMGNFLLTFTLYEVLLHFANYMAAFVISAVVGLLYTTLLTIFVTFGEALTFRNLAVQAIWYVIYSGIYAACLKLTVDHFGVPPALAPFPLLVVLTPLNFFCARWLMKVSSPTMEGRRTPSP